MSGEPGDYIGGTTSYFYTTSTGSFGASAADHSGDGVADYVQISYTDNVHWWYLEFSTEHVSGQNLLPGFYDNAQRAPFASTGHPGLNVFGDGRGCNTLTGSFTVHEANFDYSFSPPKVLNFTASFEQHCEGGTPALLGTIYYNYTGVSAVTYNIGGKVSDNLGNGVVGVPVVLSGSQTMTSSTDSGGNYSFTQLLGSGNFRLTPSPTSGYTISPSTQSVKRLNADQSVNFTAVPLYNITGQIVNGNGIPITGVSVSLSGSQTGTAFTDNSGNYSFANLRADGNYTVTPTRTNYGFSPPNRTFNTLSGNTTANFTGTLLTYTLGGRVIDSLGIGVSQVTVNLSGSQAATTQTDSNGNYSFSNVTAGGSYAITPSKVNYTFSPPSQNFSNLSGSFNSINFTGALKNYTLSGVIVDGNANSIPGVTLTLSESQSGFTATDSNGNYSFTVQAGGNYTVTPSTASYIFTPANRSYANLSSNQAGNFVGTLESIQFGPAAYTVNEGMPRVDITVTRTGNTNGAAAVNYATIDDAGLTNCNVINHIASPRCDYINTMGTLTWAAGDASPKTFSVAIIDDSYAEGDETFRVSLNNPSGASLGSSSIATVTIVDNDSTNGPNPIDSTNFFVRQQYIDFLGREPDPGGFAAWVNEIDNCSVTHPGHSEDCDRIHVSQLFFQSAEFQQRGYYVYKFYPVSFGRKPFYAEFIPDLASVSGFLSDAQLEAAKAQFAVDFTARPAFVSAYGSLNNTQYVDALLATAGVTLSNRQTLIDGLNNSTLTRAQVLRQIVESNEVSTKYFNQAYAVMEYFGYLRREPDGAYVDWIKELDKGTQPRIMVIGFVNSIEYRLRFGP